MKPTELPSRRLYLAAAAIAVATIVTFGAFLSWRLAGIGNSTVRFTAPGQHELTLTAGNHTIFHEHAVARDGTVSSGDASGLRIEITPAGAGVRLTLTPNLSSHYSMRERSGTSLFDFTAPAAGVYRVAATFPPERSNAQAQLAIGQGFVGALFFTILIGVAMMCCGLGVAAAVAARTFLARRRAAREGRI